MSKDIRDALREENTKMIELSKKLAESQVASGRFDEDKEPDCKPEEVRDTLKIESVLLGNLAARLAALSRRRIDGSAA